MARTPQLGIWIELTFRLILGVFFIVAGLLKIKDPKALTAAIETYQVLPYSISVLMALFLPWLELLAGIGVAFRKLYKGSLLILGLLLLMFVIALTQGWVRGLDVTCGCFGNPDHENQTNYSWLIIRDILLIFMVAKLWIRQTLLDKQV
ncbi:MAG: DoxX family membrane protein [Verrucomicrobia bacterium]|nr:DoxX family membrane protein [Verrucomicrobiota bacterium]MDA1067793.1 DoxX family membrane protein [Verrucomicrobiota bacterium]